LHNDIDVLTLLLHLGKKSFAYTLSFQSPDRTLTDKEVEVEINGLIIWLEKTLGISLR